MLILSPSLQIYLILRYPVWHRDFLKLISENIILLWDRSKYLVVPSLPVCIILWKCCLYSEFPGAPSGNVCHTFKLQLCTCKFYLKARVFFAEGKCKEAYVTHTLTWEKQIWLNCTYRSSFCYQIYFVPENRPNCQDSLSTANNSLNSHRSSYH